jgi:hypothetical protein
MLQNNIVFSPVKEAYDVGGDQVRLGGDVVLSALYFDPTAELLGIAVTH